MARDEFKVNEFKFDVITKEQPFKIQDLVKKEDMPQKKDTKNVDQKGLQEKYQNKQLLLQKLR